MVVDSAQRPILYFKRFRMEIDLAEAPPVPTLLPGYAWVPWDGQLVAGHAEVKYLSFAEGIDAVVFPNLGSRPGCQHLMGDISQRAGFEPAATWLITCGAGYCGTVQGVRERNGMGAIQNLGVVPTHRGRGLGTALLLQALAGFRRAGLGRAFLEVTAQNDGAIRLYRRLGFRCRKTIYKAVDPATQAKLAVTPGA
jgi:ribosomal protein S18 acetylase RimI-like enzyme